MATTDWWARCFLTTALWCSLDDNGDPLDTHQTIDDVSHEETEKLARKLEVWREDFSDLVQRHAAHADGFQLMHDLMVTSAGHGAGFWCRDYGEDDTLGAELTAAARRFGEVTPYIGDDGDIYLYGL